jgi:hypothetical protein
VALAEIVDLIACKNNPYGGRWHLHGCAPVRLWRRAEALHEADLGVERYALASSEPKVVALRSGMAWASQPAGLYFPSRPPPRCLLVHEIAVSVIALFVTCTNTLEFTHPYSLDTIVSCGKSL